MLIDGIFTMMTINIQDMKITLEKNKKERYFTSVHPFSNYWYYSVANICFSIFVVTSAIALCCIPRRKNKFDQQGFAFVIQIYDVLSLVTWISKTGKEICLTISNHIRLIKVSSTYFIPKWHFNMTSSIYIMFKGLFALFCRRSQWKHL